MFFDKLIHFRIRSEELDRIDNIIAKYPYKYGNSRANFFRIGSVRLLLDEENKLKEK